eukprot:2967997-Pyramimonas_sp.AAC.1
MDFTENRITFDALDTTVVLEETESGNYIMPIIEQGYEACVVSAPSHDVPDGIECQLEPESAEEVKQNEEEPKEGKQEDSVEEDVGKDEYQEDIAGRNESKAAEEDLEDPGTSVLKRKTRRLLQGHLRDALGISREKVTWGVAELFSPPR